MDEMMGFSPLVLAFALLALSLALLVAEFFIVSMGALAVGAFAAAAGAIYFAFAASDIAGWLFVAGIPVLAGATVRWGIERVQRSRVVPQSEITEDSGYHHFTDSTGVAVGSRGQMVTPGRPSGRARFPGGECDVMCRGLALERGAPVVVAEIDGPTVFVQPHPSGLDAPAVYPTW